jgi:hypothetical protein
MGQGKGFMANRIHATLGTFFRWGVAAVYLRATYLPERKAAMIAWGEHVAKLI